jgi:glycyl-tRNA synthetase
LCSWSQELLAKDLELSPKRREELRRIKAQADGYTPAELGTIIADLKIVSPSSGAALSEPFPFNLMFGTSIGPAGDMPGFLRPETAQGMFMNFRRLLDYNGGKVPFAATQIGTAYRNEIAPRNGLLRVREFTMAEIEHFVNPSDKSHGKFGDVEADSITLFTADAQVTTGKTEDMAVGDAVSGGIIDNQTLGYFMARTQRFLLGSGIKASGLRFRQHLRTEMAHYACDCWDAEILMSTGWVECVGHADRACYDLEVHAKATRVSQEASERLDTPITVSTLDVKPNKGALGRRYKKEAKPLLAHLSELDVEAANELQAGLQAGPVTLEVDGTSFELTADDVAFKAGSKRMVERKFTPSVIEPSFGVGRIMQGIFEHTYYVREGDADRGVFSFPAIVAPFKAAILPLDNRIPSNVIGSLRNSLTMAGLSVTTDESGVAIGRKYARADEVGIPFAVTVDHASLTDLAVTVRERDSMDQVRIPITAVALFISNLCNNLTTWKEAVASLASPTGAVSAAGAETAAAPTAAASATPPTAPEAAPAAAAASSAVPAVALSRSYNLPTAITGTARTETLTLEGADRSLGRFARPAVPIL